MLKIVIFEETSNAIVWHRSKEKNYFLFSIQYNINVKGGNNNDIIILCITTKKLNLLAYAIVLTIMMLLYAKIVVFLHTIKILFRADV